VEESLSAATENNLDMQDLRLWSQNKFVEIVDLKWIIVDFLLIVWEEESLSEFDLAQFEASYSCFELKE